MPTANIALPKVGLTNMCSTSEILLNLCTKFKLTEHYYPTFGNAVTLGAIRMTKHATYIQTVIDKALEFSDKYLSGFQAPDVWVPQEMVDKSKNSAHKGIVYWKPIPAHISENEFEAFSSKIGHRLPETYKSFLSYKYFIELNFGHEAEIFPHTPTFIQDYFAILSDTDKEETLKKGLIPFARNTDQGYFCFNTINVFNENEYTIAIYDFESGKQEYPRRNMQFTFLDLLKEFDATLDQWRQTKLSSA